ncbi:SH3 domain-containing protein [Brucella sp. IR073]|uniref:SH3 domain-containing protein n=1 Tax=unclassified Brucella TaxID=2632610 RepID=UPI003B97E567
MYKDFKLRSPFFLAGAVFLFLMGVPLASPGDYHAAAADPAPGTVLGPSGLPLPRFVSLKPSKVNLRIGPGRQYAVSWLFQKSGLPVEIIQEYDNWRRIRDADGAEGWVYQSLLSGKRTGIVAPWKKDDPKTLMNLYSGPSETSNLVARVEPGVIGTLNECDGEWCEFKIERVSGWIRQRELWGAYPGEQFD